MQINRERITLGMAIVLVAVSVIGLIYPGIGLPLLAAGVFLMVWGRHPQAIEDRIKPWPFGNYGLRALNKIDRFLFPRDEALEAHLSKLIDGYNGDMRRALKKFYITGNHQLIGPHQNRFYNDGLMEAGTGHIMPNLKDIILRILEDVPE